MKPATLDRLVADKAAERPVALVTELASGAQAVIAGEETEGDLRLGVEALGEVRAWLRQDRSGVLEEDGRKLFVQAINPALRLIIVGAVHIAQALAPMAALAGYTVTVIDPRRSFATDARFPQFRLLTEWPDEAMQALSPDGRSAVVTLTHDPKLDDPALQVALRSDAFYIGALGSKRTHAARLQRLREAGFTPAELSRIHGPAGLPIGARSPAEIALSVLAEMTAVRYQAAPARATVAAA